MKISNYQFRPSLIGLIVTTMAVAVFVWLAIWQLGRAEDRHLQMQLISEKLVMPAAQLNDMDDLSVEKRYQRFLLSGHFVNQHQLLLDNVVNKGKAGYEVITPFRLLDTDEVILINRGWIQADMNRSVLPRIDVAEDQQLIEVMLDMPRSAPVIGAQIVDTGNRWNYLDMTYYRQQSGLSVPDFLMLLGPESTHGYKRQWPQPEDKSGMHIGYAIQWSAFALIALGTFLGLSFKRVSQENEQ